MFLKCFLTPEIPLLVRLIDIYELNYRVHLLRTTNKQTTRSISVTYQRKWRFAQLKGRWVWFTRKGSFWSKSHKRKGSFVFFGKVPSKLVKISRNLSNSLRNLSFSNKEPFLCCSSDLKEPFLCCKGNIPSCARPNGCMGIEGEIFNLCIIRRQNVEGEWLPGRNRHAITYDILTND